MLEENFVCCLQGDLHSRKMFLLLIYLDIQIACVQKYKLDLF